MKNVALGKMPYIILSTVLIVLVLASLTALVYSSWQLIKPRLCNEYSVYEYRIGAIPKRCAEESK